MPALIAALIESSADCVERTVLQPIRLPISVARTIPGTIVQRLRATFWEAVSASRPASLML